MHASVEIGQHRVLWDSIGHIQKGRERDGGAVRTPPEPHEAGRAEVWGDNGGGGTCAEEAR
jgi:hypothetical protein